MHTLTGTPAGTAVNPSLNTFLERRRLRATVTDTSGCSAVMLVDHVAVEHERLLFVFLEQHGHRAHLFLQKEPRTWEFLPVFKYPFGTILQDSLGPHVVHIECEELKNLLA